VVAPRPPGSLASSQTRGAGGSKGGSLRSPDNRGVQRGLGSLVAWGSCVATPRLPGSLASSQTREAGSARGYQRNAPPLGPITFSRKTFSHTQILFTTTYPPVVLSAPYVLCGAWDLIPAPRSSFLPKYRSPPTPYSTKNVVKSRPQLYSHESIPNTLCGGRESSPSFFIKRREDPPV
jgi:hypothetical protein